MDAVSLYGGVQVGSRTMLDALVPGADALVETKDLAQAGRKAKEGADSTHRFDEDGKCRMIELSLSKETLEGAPDPGAVAVAIVLENLAN